MIACVSKHIWAVQDGINCHYCKLPEASELLDANLYALKQDDIASAELATCLMRIFKNSYR